MKLLKKERKKIKHLEGLHSEGSIILKWILNMYVVERYVDLSGSG
jgi:hypothetical protein